MKTGIDLFLNFIFGDENKNFLIQPHLCLRWEYKIISFGWFKTMLFCSCIPYVANLHVCFKFPLLEHKGKNLDETYFTGLCRSAYYSLCTHFLSSCDIWSWIFTCTDKSFDLHVSFYKVYWNRSDIQPIFVFGPLLNVKKNQKKTDA